MAEEDRPDIRFIDHDELARHIQVQRYRSKRLKGKAADAETPWIAKALPELEVQPMLESDPEQSRKPTNLADEVAELRDEVTRLRKEVAALQNEVAVLFLRDGSRERRDRPAPPPQPYTPSYPHAGTIANIMEETPGAVHRAQVDRARSESFRQSGRG